MPCMILLDFFLLFFVKGKAKQFVKWRTQRWQNGAPNWIESEEEEKTFRGVEEAGERVDRWRTICPLSCLSCESRCRCLVEGESPIQPIWLPCYPSLRSQGQNPRFEVCGNPSMRCQRKKINFDLSKITSLAKNVTKSSFYYVVFFPREKGNCDYLLYYYISLNKLLHYRSIV